MRSELRTMTPVVFLLFILLLGSSGHDDERGGGHQLASFFFRKPKKEEAVVVVASRRQRRGQRNAGAATFGGKDKDDNRCSRREHDDQNQRRRWAWFSRKARKDEQSSREAYRMAILASLAYHDFRDDDKFPTRWASFALMDDPPPSRYLAMIGSDDGREASHASSTSSAWRDKKRDRMRRRATGIVDRFQVKLCQSRHGLLRLAIQKTPTLQSIRHLMISLRLPYKDTAITSTTKDKCKRKILHRKEGGKRFNVEWILSDWHEKEANIRWHDTDLIIATSGTSDLVIAFAGTSSPADALTNIQTLEPASHSGLFEQRRGAADDANSTAASSSLGGNIHRGYLNAYARVVRGKIRRLVGDDDVGSRRPAGSLIVSKTLDDYYNECMTIQKHMNASAHRDDAAAMPTTKPTDDDRNKKRHKKKRQREGNQSACRSSGRRLMDILRNVTTSALRSGRNVHLVGHSLAGSLATIHALDVALNYDRASAPMENLHLWTFGAPEVADSIFFESVGHRSRRLRDFLADTRRHHRYVTQSIKNCGTDVVASITSSALNRGRTVRRLGGVRGDVVHVNEPSFLLCNATGVELHELRTYLSGISSSGSSSHELRTDFPPQIKSWLGEET